MVRGGFEIKVDENDDETSQFVLSNRKSLQICGTGDVLDYVKRMQENFLVQIARQKNTSIVKREVSRQF